MGCSLGQHLGSGDQQHRSLTQGNGRGSMTHSTKPFREISGERLEEFLAKGYKERHFFPHTFYFLPKAGPDGLKMARRMCGITNPNALWEIVLYACGPAVDTFPE